MEPACGPCITQRTVKQAKHLQLRPTRHTSQPLTRWTATQTWNDGRARDRHFLGSGWPQITYCGSCFHKTWDWHSLLSVSVPSSFSTSSLRCMHLKGQSHMYQRNNNPPRVCGSTHYKTLSTDLPKGWPR